MGLFVRGQSRPSELCDETHIRHSAIFRCISKVSALLGNTDIRESITSLFLALGKDKDKVYKYG